EGAGGAEGNRTPDLCSAIAALSHLSYSPAPRILVVSGCAGNPNQDPHFLSRTRFPPPFNFSVVRRRSGSWQAAPLASVFCSGNAQTRPFFTSALCLFALPPAPE